MQDKVYYNQQGQRQGYWIIFNNDKSVYFKRYYINGIRVGLEEQKNSFNHYFIYYAR